MGVALARAATVEQAVSLATSAAGQIAIAYEEE
jgi:formate-dependent phosphoribosylglycinamide formyltransferase (GAR transformylase)